MKPRQRDKRGRFTKQAPPPLVDPAIIAKLGEGRRAVKVREGGQWVITRWQRKPEKVKERDGRIC